MLSESELHRILDVFHKLGFDLYHPKLAENDNINLRNGLTEFREHLGGRLTIMLLEDIGGGVEVNEMNNSMITET